MSGKAPNPCPPPRRRATGQEPANKPIAPAVAHYLASVAPGSRRTAAESLETIAGLHMGSPDKAAAMVWESLRLPEVEALKLQLAQRFAPATANKMLSFLRGVLRSCRDLGLMAAAECGAAAGVTNVPATWQPDEVSVLHASQVRALFRTCAADPSLAGRRDAALLAIFLSSGLRRAEAAALDVGHVGRVKNKATTLTIPSPDPQKVRTVALGAAARRYLAEYLAGLDEQVDAAMPLIVPVNKGGRVTRRRLTDQAIYGMIRRIGIEAGQPTVTSRSLRLTYVLNLIARGLPVEQVQTLVGHASWITTRAYEDLATLAAAKGFRPFEIPYLPPDAPPPKRSRGATS